MAGEPQITIVGNLTADPELRFTQRGDAVASFTVASTPRTLNRQTNEWTDGETLFVRCSAWREMGENVAESLRKGTRVIVQGRLTQRTYQDRNGVDRQSLDLQVDDIGPSLWRATAQVTRTGRSGGGQGGYSQGGYDQGQGGGYGQQANYGQGYSAQGGAQQGTYGAPAGGTANDPWATGDGGSSAFDTNEPPF